MNDQFGRPIHYLRLSVTQRCNLNCVYCRPDHCPDSPTNTLLRVDQIERIVSILVKSGISRIRLTGGEPLLRQDLEEIVACIRQLNEDTEISLTTNGHGLAKRVTGLKQAGLSRVNISLDSIQTEKYATLTGGGRLDEVMRSIDTCLDAGLNPVKLNTVLMKGINDDEIEDLIEMTRNRQLQVRFIELMPLSELGRDPSRQMRASSVLERHPELVRLTQQDPSQPAEMYTIPGHIGLVGLIRPMSHKFCRQCNRIRIMADGMFKPCLGDLQEFSLLPALEQNDAILEKTLLEAIANKPRGHHFDNHFLPDRSMDRTGG